MSITIEILLSFELTIQNSNVYEKYEVENLMKRKNAMSVHDKLSKIGQTKKDSKNETHTRTSTVDKQRCDST